MTPLAAARFARYHASPGGKYARHKAAANYRGVPFLLTFDEWWSIWMRSKRWNMRGCRPGCYVMCRRGDAGAYELGNVYIARFERNLRDARGVRYGAGFKEVTYV